MTEVVSKNIHMIGYNLQHYDQQKKSQYLRSDVVLAWASLGEWEVTLLICPVDHLNSYRVIFTSEVTFICIFYRLQSGI